MLLSSGEPGMLICVETKIVYLSWPYLRCRLPSCLGLMYACIEQSLLNGSVLETDTDLQAILRKPADREPFFCELEGPNGRRLLVGLSDDAGCVEYRSGCSM